MKHFARAVVYSSTTLILSSCMPWLAGGRTGPLPPGTSQFTIGAAALVPPSFDDVLPVPQVRFRKSVGPSTDVAIEYAVPATLSASAAHWWQLTGVHVGAIGGGGVHALPGIFGSRSVPLFPFAQVGAVASRESQHREFVAVRAFAPFQTTGDFAATLWVVGNAGADYRWGRVQLTPEAGVIVQTTNVRDILIITGIALRRARVYRE